MRDLTKLSRTTEGRDLIKYIEDEIKKLSDVSDIDHNKEPLVVAAEVAGKHLAIIPLKKIIRMVNPKEDKKSDLKNREYE